MEIQSIRLEHTNTSQGSHETRSTIVLLVTKDNLDKIHFFMENVRVNNITSLYKYLNAIVEKREETLDSVFENV